MSRDQPTILQIVPRLDTGGAELSAIEIADALTRAGATALVATAGGRMLDRLTATGAELIDLPVDSKSPLRILANARRIEALIRARGIDLLHARSRAPAWSALIAARRTGCPFITTYHGAYGERGRLKRLYNSVMVRGAMVIANSQYTADLIRKRYDTPETQIRVVHRGVDAAAFSHDAIGAERPAALLRQWGVAPGCRVILQAARLTRWKGQEVLIEAARLLEKHGALDNAVVILAGDDQGRSDYRAQLVEQIAAAGLAGKVRLVGHVSDIAAAFAAAHVAVIASTEAEAFGRTAAEAQILGCPVIATRIGAPQETVLAAPACSDDERTGWLVPPGDAVAMAESLREALSLLPDTRAAMGARATRHVRTNFTLDRMKRATLAVYDSILASNLERRFVETLPTDQR